ncbi:AmmeMemoRadiSam system protein A [Lutibacter sp. B2]|nr:AmmeMemoRadiSam system protein A [Lutibacter sp. B2]
MGKLLGTYLMPHPPIMLKEIGMGEERKIQDTIDACNKIGEEIKKLKPDTIIVVTPHGTVFSDAMAITYDYRISGSLSKFGASDVEFDFNINRDLTDKICTYAHKDNILVARINGKTAIQYEVEYELDHGVMVPLYFVKDKYNDFNIVHITYGMLPKMSLYKFGRCIKKAIEESDLNAVFIASGDLSHKLKNEGPYEYSSYGEKFDKEIISLLQNGDVMGVFSMDNRMIEEASECGLRSIYMMLGVMNKCDIKGDLLSYEGPFGVGYGVMRFECRDVELDMYKEMINKREKEYEERIKNADPYVRLARESLIYYLIHGEHLNIPNYVVDEMKEEARGVFISLKIDGQLRGCIGTMLPMTESIASEIIRNAIEAGQSDPRFAPVKEEELKDISFSVDVLTKPEISNKEELDPKKYGVVVRHSGKTGVLLPDLEGIDTVEQQLSIALQKGGISTSQDYTIEKFEVIRHKE